MTTSDLVKDGYQILPEYLPFEPCSKLLAAVDEYRTKHNVPRVYRPSGSRPLHYSVIDGERIRDCFPDLISLAQEIRRYVNSVSEVPLDLLADEKVAINVNITPKSGAYRWHYDRNAVTAILYLNEVEGGETECYPNHRLNLPGGNTSFWQKIADRVLQTWVVRRIFGRRVVVKPKAGTLLIMRGNRCLHSVLPVRGNAERVNVIISFDLPGKTFPVADNLNRYLYNSEPAAGGDPNYS